MSSIATQLSFSRARNIVGGNLGSIPYQDATSSTVFIPIGSNTFVLTSNGTTATWTNPSTLSVGGSSAQVNTVLRTTSADHFLTFVDSNNPSATAESIYTTSSFVINPGTGNLGIGISPTSKLHVSGDVRITGITTVTNTTNATSTTTGALQVTGGVGIGGALWVEDSIYVKGGNIEIRDETTSSIVLARLNQQASTAVFELGRFDGIASSPAIDFHSSGGNIDFDARIISVGGSTSTTGQARLDLQANQVYLNSTQSATSTTTGALVVVGGVGVGGNIHLGGDLQVQNASYIRGRTTSGNSTRIMGINAVDTFYVGSVDTPISGGIILTVGNNRNALTISSNDIVAVTTNTNATSTTTGALVVTGGAGIGRELYVGGDIYSRGSLVLPQRIQEFIATASQTTFTVTGGYTVGSVQVFANGIQLGSGAFVASNGTTVVLNSARDTGDIIRVISGGTSSAVNNIQSFSLAMSVAFGV
jgi:hypothetical protein